jgi:hypothetical protein
LQDRKDDAFGDQYFKKTVSTQNNASINPLKLNGSLLFETVFGGARCCAFLVTP